MIKLIFSFSAVSIGLLGFNMAIEQRDLFAIILSLFILFGGIKGAVK